MNLKDFVKESNKIEGIKEIGETLSNNVKSHENILNLTHITVLDIEHFVYKVAKKTMRSHPGMDVYVGKYIPPPGGPGIVDGLEEIIDAINKPTQNFHNAFTVHCQYEKLHPFVDGNGRSGRVIWAWMKQREGYNPFHLGFLHSFYYETLSNSRI